MNKKKLFYAAGLISIGILALMPLFFRIVTAVTGYSFPSSDLVLVNVVFIFASIAGVITSAEEKHLSLAVINEHLPIGVRKIIEPILCALTVCILTALFLSALSELFMAFQPGENLWGIPLVFFFAFLPIMFFAMVFLSVSRRKAKLASIAGIIFGMIIASGPISGVIYGMFHNQSITWLG